MTCLEGMGGRLLWRGEGGLKPYRRGLGYTVRTLHKGHLKGQLKRDALRGAVRGAVRGLVISLPRPPPNPICEDHLNSSSPDSLVFRRIVGCEFGFTVSFAAPPVPYRVSRALPARNPERVSKESFGAFRPRGPKSVRNSLETVSVPKCPDAAKKQNEKCHCQPPFCVPQMLVKTRT